MPATTDSLKKPPRRGPPIYVVRHPYWKYPLLALAAAVVIVALASTAGSPNWPRATIAGTSRSDPGGAILAFTQELDGTAASWSNTGERGLGFPDQTFVLGPLRDYAPVLGFSVRTALSTYSSTGLQQQRAWASSYDAALGTISAPMGGGGGMEGTPSPDYMKIGTLHGNFGPVPTLVQADLTLAERGYLEQYLVGLDPGHSLHLPTIWLYDHPAMLNDAVANGLTDDQWGMVKERGFPVGPWYLIIPAIIHVKLPGGTTGSGFVLWNLLVALFFILALPLVPGLRNLPSRLRLYRLIYRYPLAGEAESSEVTPEPETHLPEAALFLASAVAGIVGLGEAFRGDIAWLAVTGVAALVVARQMGRVQDRWPRRASHKARLHRPGCSPGTAFWRSVLWPGSVMGGMSATPADGTKVEREARS